MSLDQVRTFVVVAEEGSVRRASERLHVTQPPLSRRILALEDELGGALFVRDAAGMSLNERGARFLEHAKKILDAVEQAQQAMAPPTSPPASRA